MNLVFGWIAFGIGMALNVQSGVNGQIRIITGNPIFASAVNFFVGTVAMVLLLLITVKAGTYKMPRIQALRETRWWMWTGGPLGTVYVMASVLLPMVIGYAAFFSMLITGQLLFSAAIDHLGWMGNEVKRIDRRKAVGIGLLLFGAIVVQNT